MLMLSDVLFYNILLDIDRETKFLNIFKNYSINTDTQTDTVFYDTYEVEWESFWDDISSEVYGTPKLWWVVALMNNVTNPFEELEAGDNITILKEEYLPDLFADIDNIAEL